MCRAEANPLDKLLASLAADCGAPLSAADVQAVTALFNQHYKDASRELDDAAARASQFVDVELEPLSWTRTYRETEAEKQRRATQRGAEFAHAVRRAKEDKEADHQM